MSARPDLAAALSHIIRTPNSGTNPAIYYRAWRDENIRKARLCSTVLGRQTWVDMAREANLRLVSAKKFARLRAQTDAELARLYGPGEILTRRQA